MIRVIKFRGKRIDNGEWVYGLPAYNHVCDNIDKIEVPAKCGGISVLVIPETVGQYTGLKDKNGDEIYENDILHVLEVSNNDTLSYHSQVEFIDCGFIVTEPSGTQVPLACFNDPNNSYPLFEIEQVGNIFNHPELLER
jgi:uncharacterized phage protein (TIGR01671 family)